MYYRIIVVEGWKMKKNPTYKGSFVEEKILIERAKMMLHHEPELTDGVPSHVFKRIRELSQEKYVWQMEIEVIPPINHVSPQSTTETSFSIDINELKEEVNDDDEEEYG